MRRNRQTEAMRTKEEAFRDTSSLIFYYDGKLIQSTTTSRISEERIAVVLTEINFEQLLRIPIAIDGTEREVAGTFLQLLEAYHIADKIIGFLSDMTSLNSCIIGGSCIIIKQFVGRPLLWLARQHQKKKDL